ncbi:MAG: carboxypeptidase regulatory-like domain-containing protein [Spirochaetales bacterium]|nr:carboxypeptidase regulatory-like domain-containing protein [Spirochaetales bacterium]
MKTTVSLLFFSLLLLFCCQPPGDSGSGTITGIIRDHYTGEPLSGVAIGYGSRSATTGTDGRYTIDLGKNSGTIIDSVCLTKTGYMFLQLDGVETDAGKENTVNIYTNRIDKTEYETINVTGRIYQNPVAPEEIPDETSVRFYIFNSTTGSYISGTLDYLDGYSVDTPTFGDDCLVIVSVGGNVSMAAMRIGVDLHTDTTECDITETPAVPAPVSITGEAAGDFVTLQLATPYGLVPAGTRSLAGTAPEYIFYMNPGGYTQCVWQVARGSIEADYTRRYQSSSEIINIDTTVTLPDIDEALGPDGPIDPDSFSYEDGIFHLDPVANTSMYQLTIINPGNQLTIGALTAPQENITLAEPIAYKLSGSPYYVMANAMDTEDYPTTMTKTLTETGFRPGQLPPGVAIGIVDRDEENFQFYALVDF